ncbi:hypothetical protein M514_06895 [Trichuris suis]|uniref:Uncharacterized protein n=1 Tax=Trichuris suis TaxID=68888 RepID=A0A085NLN0_9BILA|nr:hypothetical protein M513_06895 [Trichuris suis]KFD70376.1 hypothetical protein M514_06895 [Trichuris suis]
MIGGRLLGHEEEQFSVDELSLLFVWGQQLQRHGERESFWKKTDLHIAFERQLALFGACLTMLELLYIFSEVASVAL